MFVGELDLKPDLVVERLHSDVKNGQNLVCNDGDEKLSRAYLDEIKFENELNSFSDLSFETVKFETVALEDCLCTARYADVSENRRDLSRIDRRRRHENVERDR